MKCIQKVFLEAPDSGPTPDPGPTPDLVVAVCAYLIREGGVGALPGF